MKISNIIIPLAFGLFLAACGSNNSNENAATTDSTTAVGGEPAPTLGCRHEQNRCGQLA